MLRWMSMGRGRGVDANGDAYMDAYKKRKGMPIGMRMAMPIGGWEGNGDVHRDAHRKGGGCVEACL